MRGDGRHTCGKDGIRRAVVGFVLLVYIRKTTFVLLCKEVHERLSVRLTCA